MLQRRVVDGCILGVNDEDEGKTKERGAAVLYFVNFMHIPYPGKLHAFRDAFCARTIA